MNKCRAAEDYPKQGNKSSFLPRRTLPLETPLQDTSCIMVVQFHWIQGDHSGLSCMAIMSPHLFLAQCLPQLIVVGRCTPQQCYLNYFYKPWESRNWTQVFLRTTQMAWLYTFTCLIGSNSTGTALSGPMFPCLEWMHVMHQGLYHQKMVMCHCYLIVSWLQEELIWEDCSRQLCG